MDKTRIITLWILTVIGMILHFNYHVGNIFYGIDVVIENADKKVPSSTHLIRAIFYHLPLIYVLLLLYFKGRIFHLIMFVISIIYTFAHSSHLLGEVSKTSVDISQTGLLILVLIVALLINVEHFKAFRITKK